ncbi:Hypothetical protein HVR_LOCUS139 [uncultured virus]|nr:Hypothetical protein HVR_LOCUS139 [uncultured virus]
MAQQSNICNPEDCSIAVKLVALYEKRADAINTVALAQSLNTENFESALELAKSIQASLFYFLEAYMADEPRRAANQLYLTQIDLIDELVSLAGRIIPPPEEVKRVEQAILDNAAEIAELFILTFHDINDERTRDINQEIAQNWIGLAETVGIKDFGLGAVYLRAQHISQAKWGRVLALGIIRD